MDGIHLSFSLYIYTFLSLALFFYASLQYHLTLCKSLSLPLTLFLLFFSIPLTLSFPPSLFPAI